MIFYIYIYIYICIYRYFQCDGLYKIGLYTHTHTDRVATLCVEGDQKLIWSSLSLLLVVLYYTIYICIYIYITITPLLYSIFLSHSLSIILSLFLLSLLAFFLPLRRISLVYWFACEVYTLLNKVVKYKIYCYAFFLNNKFFFLEWDLKCITYFERTMILI